MSRSRAAWSLSLLMAVAAPKTAMAQRARSLAAGQDFTCALLDDATVRCWGENDDGQIGDGSTRVAWRPAPVSGLSQVAAIAAGRRHACAVLEDGTARCWGDNEHGQLGDGTEIDRSAPVVVRDLRGAIAIGAGDAHTCAVLHDGSMRCWGSNGSGQLGRGAPWGMSKTRTTPTSEGPMRLPERSTTPVRVPGVRRVWRVELGRQRTCAVQRAGASAAARDGAVRCWGLVAASSDARRAPATTPTPRVVPRAPPSDDAALACSVGGDGGVSCTGRPFGGARALGEEPPVQTRPFVLRGARDVTQVVVSAQHGCVVDRSGRVRCWGHNHRGQLADGSVPMRSAPAPVLGLARAVELAVGGRHACARLDDGGVRCWGENQWRQIEPGSSADRIAPTAIAISGATQISAGAAHTCARVRGGTVRCWGWNERGQLGDGSRSDAPGPVEVAGLDHVAEVRCGSEHTCARRVDGTVRCWGRNEHAQLNDGTHRDRVAPVVVRAVSDAVELVVGSIRACARRRDGTTACWGFAPPALGRATRIALGSLFACALDARGALRCFDEGGPASRGPGDATPAITAHFADVSALTAGARHACVLAAGRVHCAGHAEHGELGDGTTVARASFAVVPGLVDVVEVVAGAYQTCARRRDGTAHCWGANESSQLGDGSAAFRAELVDVRW